MSTESLVCPNGKQPCGSSDCFDPTTQGCIVDNGSLQCLNSCNGTCYSSSQYCYNGTKICKKGESVCGVREMSDFFSESLGLQCYNPSFRICYGGALCYDYLKCGSQCLTKRNSTCVRDQTICYGLPPWSPDLEEYIDVCGPQEQCYDNRTSVCLNGTTLCDGLDAQLCGTNCFRPDRQTCNNGVIQCIKSCNGTCYSDSQQCYSNSIICDKTKSVCDVKIVAAPTFLQTGLHCYDPSRFTCVDGILCYNEDVCGSKCSSLYEYSTCVNNLALCNYDFVKFLDFSPDLTDYMTQLGVCGPQLQCYNTSTSVCVGGTTVCEGLNAQLCDATCFNSKTQICTNGAVTCRNSCNGSCYANDQYCYNDVKVCNSNELVCDIETYNEFSLLPPTEPFGLEWSVPWPPSGLTCYDPSKYSCYNNSLCLKKYKCGQACLISYYSACVNNETICDDFSFDINKEKENILLCGPQKQCYDRRQSVCLNRTTVCDRLNSKLCGTNCFDPRIQLCNNGVIECIRSCNGTCYLDSQQCYNNSRICGKNEQVCDVKKTLDFVSVSLGPNCYDPSRYTCFESIFCPTQFVCNSQCLDKEDSICVNNEVVCNGFIYLAFDGLTERLALCGPERKCYDSGRNVCLGDSGTLCPIGNQLCSGVCYDPQSFICLGDNSTIYSLNVSSTAPPLGD